MVNAYNSQYIFYNDAGGAILVIRGILHDPESLNKTRKHIRVNTKDLLNCVKSDIRHDDQKSRILSFTDLSKQTALITGIDYLDDVTTTVEIPAIELFRCMGLELRNQAILELYAVDGLSYLKQYMRRD